MILLVVLVLVGLAVYGKRTGRRWMVIVCGGLPAGYLSFSLLGIGWWPGVASSRFTLNVALLAWIALWFVLFYLFTRKMTNDLR